MEVVIDVRLSSLWPCSQILWQRNCARGCAQGLAASRTCSHQHVIMEKNEQSGHPCVVLAGVCSAGLLVSSSTSDVKLVSLPQPL